MCAYKVKGDLISRPAPPRGVNQNDPWASKSPLAQIMNSKKFTKPKNSTIQQLHNNQASARTRQQIKNTYAEFLLALMFP